MTIPFAYKGEAMLVRWSETPKGRTVTLLLDPLVGEQHPFKFLKCGENGQRMQIAAALIGDDETPTVPPTKPKVAEKKTVEAEVHKERTPFDKLPRSQQAALRCCDEEFQVWLAGKYPEIWDSHYIDGHMLSNGAANATLKDVLKIASKTELDISDAKADAFDRLMTDYSVRGMVR